jgi:branched-chain amino acid transport system ATP-binding protein
LAEGFLQLESVAKSFGALRVIDGLSLSLGEHELLGIIGPNGAGKTTLFNLISGDMRADAGSIRFRGEDITVQSPHARCRRGIGRSYQIPQPFGGITVFENLLVAASFGGAVGGGAAVSLCGEILERTGLWREANQPAATLSVLQRKRLELARALATRPKLLLLDEIAGGLTDHEARELVSLISEIKRSGVAMIWIEHVVHAILALADRLMVLNFGRKLAEGAPQSVVADAEVQRVYMGIEA